MALRTLMAKKRLDEKQKELEEIRQVLTGLAERESELEQAIEEVTTDEERSAVEEEVSKFETEKAEAEEKEKNLADEVSGLEQELENLENENEKEPVIDEPVKQAERTLNREMEIRTFKEMNFEERDRVFNDEKVRSFLDTYRSAIKEKREVTNAGLLIPEVFLGVIRQNLLDYTKLYKHVNLRRIGGDGRIVIVPEVDEAVWTDCCGAINEMDLTFYQDEFACWKVAGYFSICNATLEDSDIDLATELTTAIAKGIGKALDKAILFGKGQRMPLGVATRLIQSEEPADYPTVARPWVDLHTSNVITLASGLSGAALIAALVNAFGNAKGDYSRGEKVWVMNEKTYTALVAASVSVDASGAIVAGVNGTMPVIGGVIEVLNFMPDNTIIAGYFDLYTLVERKGNQFMESQHVRFLQDETVFKGTGRYDGKPTIAEGFVVIGLNNNAPTTSLDFAPDIANSI